MHLNGKFAGNVTVFTRENDKHMSSYRSAASTLAHGPAADIRYLAPVPGYASRRGQRHGEQWGEANQALAQYAECVRLVCRRNH